MKVSQILERKANNLDIFRVVAACMVIYGHSFCLAPEAGQRDVIARLLGFDYSGSLAVKIFFFLSGLVVTNSLLEKNNPLSFAVARFFRIWPALIVTVVISACVIGPIFSTLSIREYFKYWDVLNYITDNTRMHVAYYLPGVFNENPYKDTVNGAVWTLPYEVGAYLIVLGLSMVGTFKNRYVALIVATLVILDPLFGNKLVLTWLPKNNETTLLAPCFAFGAILATYKDKIEISPNVIYGSWVLFFMFSSCSFNFYFFYFALFLTLLLLSTNKLVLKFRPKFDISYGVYLWGFPVQQIMTATFPSYGIHFNQISSLIICICLGLLSWHLVEKRFINLGRKFTQTLQNINLTASISKLKLVSTNSAEEKDEASDPLPEAVAD